MKRHKPSRTAEYMAYFRALESARPAPRRLFHDPFAPNFLSPVLRGAAAIAKIPIFAPIVDVYTDVRLPGARTSAIARTKLIDDSLLDALQDGITQVVILGAGFDCRAYRLPQLRVPAVTIFEVDHPATFVNKIFRLRRILPGLPTNVRYVQIDFLQQRLPDVLNQAGFDANRSAIFIWEGVTQYLTQESVDAVLRFVASCSHDTRIIFTYVHAGMIDGSVPFKAAARLLSGYANLGEPWLFGLRPEEANEFLRDRGLSLNRDLSAIDYRALYFPPDALGMKGYEFYHVAIATK